MRRPHWKWRYDYENNERESLPEYLLKFQWNNGLIHGTRGRWSLLVTRIIEWFFIPISWITLPFGYDLAIFGALSTWSMGKLLRSKEWLKGDKNKTKRR